MTFRSKLRNLPAGLVGGLRRFGQLGGRGVQPFLRALEVLLDQLDLAIESGDLGLGLNIFFCNKNFSDAVGTIISVLARTAIGGISAVFLAMHDTSNLSAQ